MSLPLNTPTHTPQAFEVDRYNMVEQQIRPWNVSDPDILALLGRMHREDFVPAAYRNLAFSDLEIPLREGAAGEGPAMLAPKVEARILHDLHVQPHESVLEVGTGSGFMAALLGQRARQVLTLEIDADLALQARQRLEASGATNVMVRTADGAQGAAADGPFDVIVLSGSVAVVPKALLEQLKPGGRLFAVVGDEPMMRATIVTRTDAGFTTSQPWDFVTPRLQNFTEPSRFAF